MNNDEYQQIKDIFDDFIKNWWEKVPRWRMDNEPRSLKQALELFFIKVRTIEDQLSEQKKEIEQLKKQLSTQIQASKLSANSTLTKIDNQQKFVSILDQTVEVFNTWAKNPESILPPQFGYAEGELKLREKQKIQSTAKKNAIWIVNKTGSVKYIFPNPNEIVQLSGKIDVLYTVMGNRRAKGQNKVNVQNACVIKEDGWIEYKGTLSLI